MRDEEIKRKIESFPRWHYRFNLKGNITPIFDVKHIPRHRQRKKYFFDPLTQLFGGSLKGKRVLDLGCNAGFWSLRAIESGCDYVLGIDGRQMHLDQANLVFEVNEVRKSRYDFVSGNVFELDLRKFGTFDIVLCLGLLYHVSKPMNLMEQIDEVSSDVLLIDTLLSTVPGSFMEIKHDNVAEFRDAVDYELVMVPTVQAVHDLVQQFGYSAITLKPRFRNDQGLNDYRGSHDYRTGARRAFLCAKSTDVSRLPVEVESLNP